VLALAQAEQDGPLAPITLVALAGAVLMLGALLVRERAAADPLVPPVLMATRPLIAALVVAAVLTATTSGGGVLATLLLQDALALSPAGAALHLLPLSLSVVAGSAIASRLPRTPRPTVAGLALVAAGSAVAAATQTATGIVVWAILAGLGLGAASVAATTLGVSAVADDHRATAAGLLSTAAQVGTALGVATLLLLADRRLGFVVAAALAVALAVIVASAWGHTRSPRERQAA
jgi:predicted MFS family arabinose efflux permease